MDAHSPPGDVWSDVIEDAEATATEYDAEGWEVVTVTPGDVTARTDDQFGVTVVVPGEEYAAVEEVVTDAADFDRFQVFKARDDAIIYYVTAIENPDEEVAVIVPAYYRWIGDRPMFRRARQEGVMRTHIRPLSGDDRVTFVHDNAEPFLPLNRHNPEADPAADRRRRGLEARRRWRARNDERTESDDADPDTSDDDRSDSR